MAGTPHRDWTGNSVDFRRKCKKRSFREQVSQSIELGKVHDEARRWRMSHRAESKAEKQKFPLGSGQWEDREGPRITHIAFQTDSSVSGIWKK